MKFIRNPWRWIVGEMVVPSFGSLRSIWRTVGATFFPNRPIFDQTVVDYNLARQLYRNDAEDSNLGAGFARPIIDLSVQFMDLPFASSEDEDANTFGNECIHDYWAASLQEMLRNAMRDSKTVVRIVQPKLTNKLVTAAEREHCTLKLIDPESVVITRDPADDDIITQAVVTHWVSFDEPLDVASTMALQAPNVREHEILEVITPRSYRYYDKTEHEWIPEWETANNAGFVPLHEVWNEYDSTLSGGQSDLESCFPFLKAFHEVMLQGLQAHKYHSTPKLQLNVKDVQQFIKNNWPDVLNEDGTVKTNARIQWQGKEILFFQSEEQAGFIEAKSVLGDTKTLLEFLIDCIAVASETPEWGFMRVEAGTSQGAMNAQTLPFEKKMQRKRRMFAPDIQMILKMVFAINGKTPNRIPLTWPAVRKDDLVTQAQAVQQLIMGLDVATQHQWVADGTAVSILGHYFDDISSPAKEKAAAKNNLEIIPPAPALPPGGSNGSGSKSSAKKSLATTKSSNS